MERPFKMWLYPLPPIVALIGFGYIVFVRRGSAAELMLAGAVVLVGTVVFVTRGALGRSNGRYSTHAR